MGNEVILGEKNKCELPMVIPNRKKMTKITKQGNAIVIYNLFYSFHSMVRRFMGICTCSNSICFCFCGLLLRFLLYSLILSFA